MVFPPLFDERILAAQQSAGAARCCSRPRWS
jgi:hypothetical protein